METERSTQITIATVAFAAIAFFALASLVHAQYGSSGAGGGGGGGGGSTPSANVPLSSPTPPANPPINQNQNQNSTTLQMPSTMMPMNLPPMILSANRTGSVLLRGIVVSASSASSTLMVNSWGGTWTIRTSANTRMIPASVPSGTVRVGDFIGLQGMVAGDQSFTVNATLVRDWTMSR